MNVLCCPFQLSQESQWAGPFLADDRKYRMKKKPVTQQQQEARRGGSHKEATGSVVKRSPRGTRRQAIPWAHGRPPATPPASSDRQWGANHDAIACIIMIESPLHIRPLSSPISIACDACDACGRLLWKPQNWSFVVVSAWR